MRGAPGTEAAQQLWHEAFPVQHIEQLEELGLKVLVGDERAEALLEIEIERSYQGVSVKRSEDGLVDAAGEGRCGLRHGGCCSLANGG